MDEFELIELAFVELDEFVELVEIWLEFAELDEIELELAEFDVLVEFKFELEFAGDLDEFEIEFAEFDVLVDLAAEFTEPDPPEPAEAEPETFEL